jgi:hypothetical protein
VAASRKQADHKRNATGTTTWVSIALAASDRAAGAESVVGAVWPARIYSYRNGSPTAAACLTLIGEVPHGLHLSTGPGWICWRGA